MLVSTPLDLSFLFIMRKKERKKKKGNATFSNLDRTDRRDYPEDAIRESLLNSIPDHLCKPVLLGKRLSLKQ